MRFTADIRFFEPSEGGRTPLANQGYRPTIKFAGCKILFAGKIEFLKEEGEPYPPGSRVPRKVRADIRMPNCQLEAANVKAGGRFQLTEGTHPVAEGAIEATVDTCDYDIAGRPVANH